jgi:hypothetical protein
MSLSAEVGRLFDESLQSRDPVLCLRDAVRGLLTSGKTCDDLRTDLEELRTLLREEGRGVDEDAVLEVMDFLVGWSSPHMKT